LANIKDGANYAPQGKALKVVEPGQFYFAAAFLDHGHINGQCNGLIAAGAELKYVYEPDAEKRDAFIARYPGVIAVDSFDSILAAPEIQLVASAAIPNRRAEIGMRVLEAGKDYFTDKSPFTSLEQLNRVKDLVDKSKQKYAVYYAERLHNDAAWQAGELIKQGAIGRVLHVSCLAPHRLAKATRPPWFFDKAAYGGILTDIGSHQVEQFLSYADCSEATLNYARVANLNNPDKPGLEDFGEMSFTASNGASFYSRVDWFTPEGLRTWGDGRTFIVGTEGSIEVRKYIEVCAEAPASNIYLINAKGEQKIECLQQSGFPYFGQLILDCINRTEHAMSQAHCFKAAELSLLAQQMADRANLENR
jgi:predicted dehydrogenase